ncbi:hypothetical protein [Pseudalkalibacillus caeni]|uniref:Uncharacterized protein n=1 Tax=Exobacillus caeni TaxID=2574798 RepID=A0A5R9F1X4_9BACL|nr:hypothetical protein [Pseudalkalibacillus caeni]TLS36470.1 hypothetical protein FCL54_14725 [Pseudalkalibacillus caeni]
MWKKIGSWFIKKGWPIIQKFIAIYGEEIVRGVIRIVSKFYNERQRKKAAEKMQKAEEYRSKADNEGNAEKKKEYEFKSDFYKEEAETYAKDILEMANIFQDIEYKTTKLVKEKTLKLQATDLFETGKESEFKLKKESDILKLSNEDQENEISNEKKIKG